MIKFGNYKREFGFLGRIAAITVILVSSIMFGSCEKYLDIDQYVYDQTTLDSIFLSAPERKSISMEQLLFFPMNQYL